MALINHAAFFEEQFGKADIKAAVNRYLSIILLSKRMAIAYQDAVEQFWGDRVETKRYRLS